MITLGGTNLSRRELAEIRHILFSAVSSILLHFTGGEAEKERRSWPTKPRFITIAITMLVTIAWWRSVLFLLPCDIRHASSIELRGL